ncbi:hypothetical protein QWY75_05100 [Pontixanthobacter aestiaquae]|uniref:Uncharacterized protein n=1 Tax=Pontixanthobacter aestiaquae TaxID=1509367 RepID=A0A844Z997_9SPHN|nr:hypothetical protein [Pontixanthobacter aestiaquae]MDN3645583.1 hypothetical protein [Pontixanthobacter aestiaquae]MXO83420.1 hypothetical protein [Pontixanthobacter aestiaquae]
MRFGPLALSFGAISLAFSASAQAQNAPRLTQAMFVERTSESGTQRSIEPAETLKKGDRVILLVKWKSNSPHTSFTVASAVPAELAFERSSLRSQDISVDGGRNWGRIGQLTIEDYSGPRLASVEDVTHLRWTITPDMAVRGKGTITYSAIVR